MKSVLVTIAAILALAIGGMAAVAGVQVLLGNDPGYYVINWLPVYNYTAGVLTVCVTAVLIWRRSRFAGVAAVATLGAHSLVMVVLVAAYGDVVAVDSIRAMTVRMLVWAVIIGLMYAQVLKERTARRRIVKDPGDGGDPKFTASPIASRD